MKRILAPYRSSDERSPVVCRPSTLPVFSTGGVGGGLLFRMARVILLLDVYVTVEGFVDIGYIAGVECIFGRARWLKTRRTRLSSRAQPTS